MFIIFTPLRELHLCSLLSLTCVCIVSNFLSWRLGKGQKMEKDICFCVICSKLVSDVSKYELYKKQPRSNQCDCTLSTYVGSNVCVYCAYERKNVFIVWNLERVCVKVVCCTVHACGEGVCVWRGCMRAWGSVRWILINGRESLYYAT